MSDENKIAERIPRPFIVRPGKNAGDVRIEVTVVDKTDHEAVMSFKATCMPIYRKGVGPTFPPPGSSDGKKIALSNGVATVELSDRPIKDKGFLARINLYCSSFEGVDAEHKYAVVYRVFQNGTQLEFMDADQSVTEHTVADRTFKVVDFVTRAFFFKAI